MIGDSGKKSVDTGNIMETNNNDMFTESSSEEYVYIYEYTHKLTFSYRITIKKRSNGRSICTREVNDITEILTTIEISDVRKRKASLRFSPDSKPTLGKKKAKNEKNIVYEIVDTEEETESFEKVKKEETALVMYVIFFLFVRDDLFY